MTDDIYMGRIPYGWNSDKKIKTITFNVTDDCNLACTYCYFLNKSSHKKMSFDTAKKAVDYILTSHIFDIYDGVVWDFVGGEPTIEIDLVDKICDYIVEKMFDIQHKWFFCYKFMMSSNGLLYSSLGVQNLIKKHGPNIQIAISLDGTKQKHDMSRVRKDGTGSYDEIIKQVPLWREQQRTRSTKATFAHNDISLLKESIVNLWELGIENVMANIVFENCWDENDPVIFEKQLRDLADYVIDNELWNKYSVRFFDPHIDHPLSCDAEEKNYCGAGSMLAVSTDGDFYPCARFMESAMYNNKKGLCIGNVETGIDSDKLRPFLALDTVSQSNNKCIECEVASGCAWCSGHNYSQSHNNTIFERQTFICEMHKANVRALEYFWYKFEDKTGMISPLRKARINNISRHQKYLYILLDSFSSQICQFNPNYYCIEMPQSMVKEAILFCDIHHIVPIFVGKDSKKFSSYGLFIDETKIWNIEDIQRAQVDSLLNSYIVKSNRRQLPILAETIINIYNSVAPRSINIDVYFEDLHDFSESDCQIYKSQLYNISNYIIRRWKNNELINLNLLTHIIEKNNDDSCMAGIKKYALAPDGRFYICPAFYFDNELRDEYVIEDLKTGIDYKYEKLCQSARCVSCRSCKSTQCTRCAYLGKKYTGEFCVPPEIECVKSSIEREVAFKFYEEVKNISFVNEDWFANISSQCVRLDPLNSEKLYGFCKYH